MKRQIIVFSGLFVLFFCYLVLQLERSGTQYKVKNGDTLYSISKKFSVSIHEIRQDNNLQKSRIKPKQILNISSEEGSPGTFFKTRCKVKIKPVYYTVKKGDTLSRIARKTHHPMKQIVALNQINKRVYESDKKLFWQNQHMYRQNQYASTGRK